MPAELSFFSHTQPVCPSVIVPSPLSTNRGNATGFAVHGPHALFVQTNVCAPSMPASHVVPSGFPEHRPAGPPRTARAWAPLLSAMLLINPPVLKASIHVL